MKHNRILIKPKSLLTFLISSVILGASIFSVLWISNVDNQTSLRMWIERIGPLGWFAVMLLQFLQIVIAPIAAEPIQIMSGAVYGVIGGLILNVLAFIPATILVFWVGKKFGRPLLNKLFGEKRFDKLKFLQESNKLEFIAIIFLLLPAAPKDIVSYLCGMSFTLTPRFLLMSTIARIPSTLMCTMIGASLQEGEWEFAVIIAAAMVFIVLIGIKYKDKLAGK